MRTMRPMHREQDDSQVFTRRAVLAAGGSVALMGVIAARLYDLQVVEKDYYTRLAEDNRVNRRLLAPIRGPHSRPRRFSSSPAIAATTAS